MVRILAFAFIFCASSLKAESLNNAPVLRLRMGMNMLNFSVGDTFSKKPLGEIMSFSPTVLWALPSFRAKIGFHYLGDFGSKYGATPISGIGLSSYFYPFGLSTAYEIGADETLIQKSKPGPYTFATLTPVNFNLNATKEQSPSGEALSFSAYMIEVGFGAGYDYPVSPNRVLAIELQYRVASAQEKSSKQAISYSGIGAVFTFSTSYH